jgi:AraC-like DNA-binding protein
MVDLVREFAGPGWHPRALLFEHGEVPGVARESFPNTRIRPGQTVGALIVERSILCLPPGRRLTGPLDRPPSVPEFDFVESLRAALPAYLGDGYPSIELAADIGSTSVRTLQRRLAERQLTYSDLIEQIRFDVSARLLGEPEQRVIDVAKAVGYRDASHFTRAFHRFAGLTPTQFRSSSQLSIAP